MMLTFAAPNSKDVGMQNWNDIGASYPGVAKDRRTTSPDIKKEKSTLLSVMLKEIGVASHYVIINTERGSVLPSSPPPLAFNRVILAIVLPNIEDASLLAIANHPKLGKLVFFDPTDSLTPFGRLNGAVQANYGVLTTDEGSDLWQLPKLAPSSESVLSSH
jgi:hypothetical protein